MPLPGPTPVQLFYKNFVGKSKCKKKNGKVCEILRKLIYAGLGSQEQTDCQTDRRTDGLHNA